MEVKPIKTHKITIEDTNLIKIIDTYVEQVSEKSVLAITSKIISLSQGRVVKKAEGVSKNSLVPQESQLYTDPHENKYGASIAITHNRMVGSAGIDGGNTDGYFVLWPENLQETVNQIRDFIRTKYKVKDFGVIVTDSTSIPLQKGPIGIGIAYSGFTPLVITKGTKADVFEKDGFTVRHNVLGGLAAAAVLVMGEGSEQTPMALMSELEFVEFVAAHPTQQELDDQQVTLEDDLFHNLWDKVNWKNGKLGVSD